MGATCKRAHVSALQIFATLGIVALGVDAVVIQFVHRNLTPRPNHFFGTVSELANECVRRWEPRVVGSTFGNLR